MKRFVLFGLLLSPWVFAAVALDEITETSSNLASEPKTVNLPSHENGDLLLALHCSTNDTIPTDTITVDTAGWTTAVTVTNGDGGSPVRLTAYFKSGNGSETTVVFSADSTDHQHATSVLEISGADIGIHASGTAITSGATTTGTVPSVTTSVTNTLIIFAACWDDDVGTDAICDDNGSYNGTSPPDSMHVVTAGSGQNGASLCIAVETQAGAGASNSSVMTFNDTEHGVMMTLAIEEPSIESSVAAIMHNQRRKRQ